MPIFLPLVLVPLIEIALFIELGGWLGLWPTLAIVVLTALAGATLIRAQGLAALGEIRRRLERGEDPTGPLAHGALIVAAGLLLLTPGFFTDSLGLVLLVPAVRAAVIRFIARRIAAAAVRGPRRRGGAVEGEYEVLEPRPGRRGAPECAAGGRRG
jgi:UPF0716 protein FxsA